METFFVLLAAAGLAAGIVWRAAAPASPRSRVPRPPRKPPARRQPPPRPFELPPPQPADPPHEAFVLVESTIPDERPSPAAAVLRLVVTIALVGAVGVAILAVVWLILAGQLSTYLAR